MAQYTKNFTFDAAEGWVDEAGSANMVFAVITTDGQPQPCGEFSGALLTHGQSDSDKAKTALGTFESIFGVTPGSTITSIQCTSADYRYFAATSNTASVAVGTLKVRPINNSGVNLCIQDLLVVSLPGITPGAWTTVTTGADTNTTSALASASDFRLEIQNLVDNGAFGSWQNPQYHFDNITIVVTAQSPLAPGDDSGDNYQVRPPQLNQYQTNFLRLPVDSSDKEAGGASLKGLDDEDFDPNRIFPAPVPLNQLVPLPITDDSDTPLLSGQDDEDFWNNMVAPLIGNNFQPLPRGFVYQTEEQAVVSTTLGPEEEFWRKMVAPLPPAMYQQFPVWTFRDAGEISPGSAPLGPAVILRKWMSVQQANLWCVCRVAATGVFNLDLLTTADPDNGPNYIIKQVESTPLAGVDGTTATYTNHVQLSIPWPAIGQLQIYGASGLLYYADVRFYYKLRHRRR